MFSHAVLSAFAVSRMASFLWPGVKDAVARGVPKHSRSARRQEAPRPTFARSSRPAPPTFAGSAPRLSRHAALRARARGRRHVSRATHSATIFVGLAYRVAPSPPSIPSVRLCFASPVPQQRLCEVGPRLCPLRLDVRHGRRRPRPAGWLSRFRPKMMMPATFCGRSGLKKHRGFPHLRTLGGCSAIIETVRRTHRIVNRKTRRFQPVLF
jgi:hypothetical protein